MGVFDATRSHSLPPTATALAAVLFSILTLSPPALAGQSSATVGQTAPASGRPCRWWHFHRCDQPLLEPEIEGLPDGAPRTGTVITVDLSTNRLYLFEDGKRVLVTPAATGSGKILAKGHEVWLFETPQGRHTVQAKVVDPVWRKPDWAYLEEGKRVPPWNHPSRNVKGKLGRYALSLGDGIMIHGTDDPSSIGRRVSHGCIRLPARALATVYRAATIGTEVYIYTSEEPRDVATSRGRSDLDIRDSGGDS